MDPLAALQSSAAAVAGSRKGQPPEVARREALRESAVAFEAVFLAQMLEHAGVGKTSSSFGGGAGEQAFRSRLLAEQARLMAENGGLGLADEVYSALLAREGLSETPQPETAR